MLFTDTFLTIDQTGEGTYKDRGSRFVAYAFPIIAEAELKPIIAKLKAEHPKANHYCWALRLDVDRSVFRLNDDGEPAGTAGRPILNILLSKDLTNVAVIVVRYFGGTLLGVPGLINAYKSAAEEALRTVKFVEQTVKDVYLINFNYLQMNDVMKIVKDNDLKVLDQQFDTECAIRLAIRKTQVNRVMDQFMVIPGLKACYESTI